jgi:hypothetical protein
MGIGYYPGPIRSEPVDAFAQDGVRSCTKLAVLSGARGEKTARKTARETAGEAGEANEELG